MSTRTPANGRIKFAGDVDSSLLPVDPAIALLLDGASLQVLGGGLAPSPIISFPAAQCRAQGPKRIRCKSTAGETALFVRSRNTARYKVKILARKRPMDGPLAPVAIHAVLSLGGTDVRFALGGCAFQGTTSVRCNN